MKKSRFHTWPDFLLTLKSGDDSRVLQPKIIEDETHDLRTLCHADRLKPTSWLLVTETKLLKEISKCLGEIDKPRYPK